MLLKWLFACFAESMHLELEVAYALMRVCCRERAGSAFLLRRTLKFPSKAPSWLSQQRLVDLAEAQRTQGS